MRSKLLLSAAIAAASAMAVASAASAAPIITNGNFNSGPAASTQFGAGADAPYNTQPVSGWTGDTGLTQFFVGGTQSTTPATNQWNDNLDMFAPYVTTSAGGTGGNFLAIDGDPTAEGQVSTTMNNLEIGKTYTLTFDWAAAQLLNRNASYTIELEVLINNALVYTTPNEVMGAQAFSGWMSQGFSFTATGASETLSFLAVGTPAGEPPVALLDNVNIAVPEPATWAMMILGFGAVGFAMRRRNAFAAV